MNKLLKILTVDDEPLARRIICRQLKEDSRVKSVFEAKNGDEAFEMICKFEPEIVFLDIQMPGCNGFELLEKIQQDDSIKMPLIIFVTAFDEFAVKAFEFHALDYLLKPFDKIRFKKSFELAVEQISAQDQTHYQQKLLQLIGNINSQNQNPEWVSVKKDDNILLFSIKELIWIEAQGNHVMLYLTETKNLIREKMSVLEAKLDPLKFIRIHRSTIVNVAFIKEIEDWGKGEYKIVMSTGNTLNVSNTYRHNLDTFFSNRVI